MVEAFFLAIERLRNHSVLVLWICVGLAVAATLVVSLSLFVDATNTTVMGSHLPETGYAFRFRYLGAWEGNITEPDVVAADLAIVRGFAETIGLPVKQRTRFVRGGNFRIARDEGTDLGTYSLGLLEGAEPQIRIVVGQWPHDAAALAEEFPVMLPMSAAYQRGIRVNDVLNARRADGTSASLKVVGLWEPINALDVLWIFTPRYFDEVMLVPPDAFWQIANRAEYPIDDVAWFLAFDGSAVRTVDVARLVSNSEQGLRAVKAALPGINLDLAPITNLNAFLDSVDRMLRQLLVILLPISGLVLYFVSLISGQLVLRQQHEDAVLRSRGMTRSGLITIHGLMWLMLGLLALCVSFALSPLVVTLIGKTTAFMRFEGADMLCQITITHEAICSGIAICAIAAISGLSLTLRTSRETVTSYRKAITRATRAWWQRVYLDVLLLVPSIYALFTLWERGGIRSQADNPFGDPLTLVGPMLFSLSLTLLLLRAIPALTGLLARLVRLTSSVALLMALRELSRSIGRYRGTLLMVGFTLSMMGFTASMASTIDRSLVDSVNYAVGADVVMVSASDAQTEQYETDDGRQPSLRITGYNVLPPTGLMALPGVRQVSRVRSFPAHILSTSPHLEGVVLGVDRAAIAAVVRSRPDYAPEPYADVFNRLAGNRTGAIISTRTAVEHNLQVGQQLEIQITALSEWYQMRVPIVGMVSYFPTLDPTGGFFVITTLDPLFELIGTPLPFEYWLGLAPGTDRLALREQARQAGYPVIEWRDPEVELSKALASPSRRGVLGFLSVGFMAALVLTLVSTVVQISAAFRAQSAQLGSLRAMGLSAWSVGWYLILLQGMIAIAGIGSGVAIGITTALLFLPLLDFSSGVPPYFVRVAWHDVVLLYSLIAVFMLVVTLVTTLLVSRQQVSTVLKIGDA